MRKINREITLLDNIKKTQNKSFEKIKTTNVNILLNRVRIDQKRIFKKKLLFSSICIALLCTIIAYLII